jgi:ribonuclease E
MAKKMLIDATHSEETRVVVVDGNKVEEFDFESENRRQLAGNIYLAKVTRVEPSLQAAFVDYGGNRHGFLAFTEIHPDYYQIPVADREKLMAEEAEYARAAEEDEKREKTSSSSRSFSRNRRSEASSDGAATASDSLIASDLIEGDDDDNGLVDVPESREEIFHEPLPLEAETDAESGDAESNDADSSAAETSDSDDDSDGENDAAPTQNRNRNRNRYSDRRNDQNQDQDDQPERPTEVDNGNDDDLRTEFRPRKPRARRYKIQEVIKVRQILLVQVVKEERGNKGAALTTYLSLAGRYCVLMPNTARGGGISRKITNVADRKKLKEIATDIVVPNGAGLIIRTAGAKRTKTEIKRDYEYLLRQWEQVRDLTLKSIAPAAIYEEGDLIKRSIRDLYNREIDEIFVEGDAGFVVAKEYMKMLMPSHASRVKHYVEPLPLFSRFQVEAYLDGMFNPTVQLKSGGYIVIGITEALVAIDVNSGKATKEGSIEDTALRTNLEAADEVARQLKLRDLAGLIVIDFIDMEERRNNTSVEKRIKDKLKNDRARIQVGGISGFGLMEMSRQRLRPGMLEATTQPCAACHGTGITRSDDSMALQILRELEEEGNRNRTREILVTVPVAIANYLLNEKRDHIIMIEARYGMAIRIESDSHLISPEHKMEKFKTTTRRIPKAPALNAITIDTVEPTNFEDDIDEAEDLELDAPAEAETTAATVDSGEEQPKKKRRRRRRRSNNKDRADNPNGDSDSDSDEESEEPIAAASVAADTDTTQQETAMPAPKPAARTRKPRASASKVKEETAPEVITELPSDDAPKPKPRRTTVKAKATAETLAARAAEDPVAPAVALEKPAKPARKPRVSKAAKQQMELDAAEAANAQAAQPEPMAQLETPVQPIAVPIAVVAATPEPAPSPAPEQVSEPEPELEPVAVAAEPAKPKRAGWWSRATGK